MSYIVDAVEQFNRVILDLPIPPEPRRLSEDRKSWAATAFSEEVHEFITADTIEEEADALMDLVYFAIGRFQEMGVNPRPVLNSIHIANMRKVRGDLDKRPGSQAYDAVKPPGWVAPIHNLQPYRVGHRPKLLIIGHARHGKDMVADILRHFHLFNVCNASMFCAEHVIMPVLPYATVLDCYEDRVNHRATWFRLIQDYLADDPARIGEAIFKDHDIYCGIRNVRELEAVKKITDYTIWVDARKRQPLEDPSSIEVQAHMADIVIDNNGTVDDLVNKTLAVARMVGAR